MHLSGKTRGAIFRHIQAHPPPNFELLTLMSLREIRHPTKIDLTSVLRKIQISARHGRIEARCEIHNM